MPPYNQGTDRQAQRASHILQKLLPEYAVYALEILERAGFEAWIVGGWVRDALLGSATHDIDITTSAHWEQTAETYRAAGYVVHETGTKHGTVTVVVSGHPLEITTYRTESTYSDHRHPDEVCFVDSIDKDLARRDFTVNAMAFHPRRGLLDPYHGRHDLQQRCIRAVGDAQSRFEEDALRVLRAIRFACKLGFSIEKKTADALSASASRLAFVAQERIGNEMCAIMDAGVMARALRIGFAGVAAAVPELTAMEGFDQQSPYHAYDVCEHTARVCAGVEAFSAGRASCALRWAALLHDVAKPKTFSEDVSHRGHFFGHPEVSAQMAQTILESMAIPQSVVRQAIQLIRWHDLEIDKNIPSIRRFIATLDKGWVGGGALLATQIIELKQADALAKAPACREYALELDDISRMVKQEIQKGVAQNPQDLAVSGTDIMQLLHMGSGPSVGMYLRQLFEAYLAGEVDNTREDLLALLV